MDLITRFCAACSERGLLRLLVKVFHHVSDLGFSETQITIPYTISDGKRIQNWDSLHRTFRKQQNQMASRSFDPVRSACCLGNSGFNKTQLRWTIASRNPVEVQPELSRCFDLFCHLWLGHSKIS